MPASPPGSAMPSATAGLLDVGLVAIGRNEGERLVRCLDALPAGIRGAVYVDSDSTDGSVEQAERRGLEVVRLDLSIPFTAARARNAGLSRLWERWPDLRYVQFVDGDCALVPGWIEAGVAELEASPRLAVVCGRRREIRPGASIYNRLADLEWDTPAGDADACGGDALARAEALREVGGFDGRLIAGEEPELCVRLRARGWGIRRIAREMTRHDAAMTRVAQWWRRAVRGGHAYAEVHARHPATWGREVRSILAWGLALPVLALLSVAAFGGRGAWVLAGYPVLWLRVLRRRAAGGDSLGDAALYASSCVAGKFPELAGALRFWWNRRRGRPARIIEYK